MKFQRRRGVSVIIATLLLIAIAVAAGILLYVFVNGLAGSLTTGGGQQTTERLQMQSYNFAVNPTNCLCPQQILELFIQNSGSSTTTISAVYYDGVLQTTAVAPTVVTALATGNAYYTSSAGLIKDIVTCTGAAGAAQSFCSTVAGSGLSGFGQLYNPGDTGQLVIAFTSGVTAGTGHTIKVVSTTGATNVFSVTAGRNG